jgi:hypothetical protein
MENALKITHRRCKVKGLVVNPLNTRKYKPETAEPFRLEGKEIIFTSTVKYLGFLLDPTLNWKHHLTERRKKFYS